MPNETIAGGDCLNDTVAMVDGQMQGVATWTVLRIHIVVCVVARDYVVVIVPRMTVAGLD